MKFRKAGVSGVMLASFLLCSIAEAVRIGPVQTKKERERSGESQSFARPGAYEAVLESFLNEDFAQSERLAARFLERRSKSGPLEEVSYLRALSLMKLGRFADARPVLKQLESEASSTGLRAQAAYSLGDSYYFEQKRAEADVYYKEAVEKYPAHGEAGKVKRLLGLSPMRPLGQFGVEETVAACLVPALGQPQGLPLQFSVQVGAFSRRRNAERLLNRLLRNHYDAYISQETAPAHYRVRVGHFPAREEANGTALRLQKDGYPTKIIP